MHWSTKVQHACEFIYSNFHLLCRARHVRILAGNFDKFNEFSFLFYRDEDNLHNKLSLANKNVKYSNMKNKILNNF